MAKKKNNFSIYWIYAILAVGLIAFQMYMGQSHKHEADSGQLEALFMDSTFRGVDEVTIVNRENAPFAEFKLNKEGVDTVMNSKRSKFSSMKKSLTESEEKDKTQILFEIKSINPDRLDEKLDAQNITVKYEERTDYLGTILSYLLPFVIIIAIWIFVMRRMSGGAAGGSGQIFNIGKSKAKVYENGKTTNCGIIRYITFPFPKVLCSTLYPTFISCSLGL